MGGPGKCDGKTVMCVDNFQPTKFVVDGVDYCSAENYFQAAKCVNKAEFEKVRRGGCGADVWMVGSMVQLRPDWEPIKVRIMYDGNKAKFEQNKKQREELLATQGPITFSNSTAFWCKWNGLICELVREELREEKERDEERIAVLQREMNDYEQTERIKMNK